jgi:uncharacterized membrane protein YbhN (UPF0104 family)
MQADEPSAKGQGGGSGFPGGAKSGKILSFALRFLVSIALVVWIVWSIDFGMFSRIALSPRPAAILAMVAFCLLFVFLGGLKLWFLMKGFATVGYGRFLGYFFLSGSIGSLAPAIVGDVTFVGLMKRENMSIHETVSALLVDRLVTLLLAVFVFTPFTLSLVWPAATGTIVLLSVVAALASAGLMWVAARFAPAFFQKVEIMNRYWLASSLYFSRYRRELLINVMICAIRGIVSGLTLIFALMAAGLDPPAFATICISNSLSVLTHIPVSLSGLGVFEGSGLLLFETIGLNKERIVAGLFFHRAYIIIWASVTAVLLTSWLLWQKHRVRT